MGETKELLRNNYGLDALSLKKMFIILVGVFAVQCYVWDIE
jgi:hypothetical protein